MASIFTDASLFKKINMSGICYWQIEHRGAPGGPGPMQTMREDYGV